MSNADGAHRRLTWDAVSAWAEPSVSTVGEPCLFARRGAFRHIFVGAQRARRSQPGKKGTPLDPQNPKDWYFLMCDESRAERAIYHLGERGEHKRFVTPSFFFGVSRTFQTARSVFSLATRGGQEFTVRNSREQDGRDAAASESIDFFPRGLNALGYHAPNVSKC